MDGVLAVRELFKAKAGTEYRLEIEREGKTKSIKLKLRDLY
jgi:C-terminal processing protease CtpA/Prc